MSIQDDFSDGAGNREEASASNVIDDLTAIKREIFADVIRDAVRLYPFVLKEQGLLGCFSGYFEEHSHLRVSGKTEKECRDNAIQMVAQAVDYSRFIRRAGPIKLPNIPDQYKNPDQMRRIAGIDDPEEQKCALKEKGWYYRGMPKCEGGKDIKTEKPGLYHLILAHQDNDPNIFWKYIERACLAALESGVNPSDPSPEA